MPSPRLSRFAHVSNRGWEGEGNISEQFHFPRSRPSGLSFQLLRAEEWHHVACEGHGRAVPAAVRQLRKRLVRATDMLGPGQGS